MLLCMHPNLKVFHILLSAYTVNGLTLRELKIIAGQIQKNFLDRNSHN